MPAPSGGKEDLKGEVVGLLLDAALQRIFAKWGDKPATQIASGQGKKTQLAPEQGKATQLDPGQNPSQQSVPPMTQSMLNALGTLVAKMNAGSTPPPPNQGGGPPNTPDQTQATSGQQPTPSNLPGGKSLGEFLEAFKRILSSVPNAVAGKLDTARKGVEGINRAVDDPQEVIRRGRERGGFRGDFQAATGGVVQGLQRDRPLVGVGDAAGAIGDAGGSVPVVGGMHRSFFKLNEVLLKSVDRLRGWNDRLHEGNIRFAEFSGHMMAVQQQSEARRIQLDIQKGEALSKSAKELAEAKDQLNVTFARLDIGWQWIQNRVGTALSKTVDLAAKTASFGMLGGPLAQVGPNLHEWMGDLAEHESKRPDSLIPPPQRWGPS